MARLRQVLDGLYFASGVAAALFLIAILVLIVLQMVARWTGFVFPGAPNYAGYSMAAASFLAFATALTRGTHIRVSLLLNVVPKFWNKMLNIWCYAIGTVVAWYVVYYAFQFTYWSWKFTEVSQGQDATPVWIPQAIMVTGATVLAIALTDNLLHLIFSGQERVTKSTLESLE